MLKNNFGYFEILTFESRRFRDFDRLNSIQS